MKRSLSYDDPWCLESLLRASMKRPKANITSPQYRFTLESVRAARSDGQKTPMPTSIRPTMVKKKPVGTLKSSILCKPEIQEYGQCGNGDGKRYGTFVPAYSLVVFQFGKTVYQAVQFGFRARSGGEADQDRHDKTSGPRRDGDPEILRHGGGELIDGGDPSALAFGQCAAVGERRRHGAAQQAGEGGVTSGALPEHAQQEGAEERSGDDAQHHLQQVVDAVVALRQVSRTDGERHRH